MYKKIILSFLRMLLSKKKKKKNVNAYVKAKMKEKKSKPFLLQADSMTYSHSS